MNQAVLIKEPTNGAKNIINARAPYVVSVALEGSADLLFHRWNAEAIDEKACSAKGGRTKKTDDVESYVYRDEDGNLCIPGEYLRGAIINAAKFRQDPRSPRKSAMDLYKAGIVVTTNLSSLGLKEWDYLDKRRVTVQRNGINRVRPAVRSGWRSSFDLMVVLPEYIEQAMLRDVIDNAGRLIGLGDFRPTFGRFNVVGFDCGLVS